MTDVASSRSGWPNAAPGQESHEKSISHRCNAAAQSQTSAANAGSSPVRPALARARSAASLQPRAGLAAAGLPPRNLQPAGPSGEAAQAPTRQLRMVSSSGSLPPRARAGALDPSYGAGAVKEDPPPADLLMGQRVVVVGLAGDSGINGHGGVCVRRTPENPTLIQLQLNEATSSAGSSEVGTVVTVAEANLRTLLYFAASNGIADTVAAEIQTGVSRHVLNWQDSAKGRSALWSAAFYGEVRCVETLISARATVDLKNKSGFAPLWGECSGPLRLLRLLRLLRFSAQTLRACMHPPRCARACIPLHCARACIPLPLTHFFPPPTCACSGKPARARRLRSGSRQRRRFHRPPQPARHHSVDGRGNERTRWCRQAATRGKGKLDDYAGECGRSEQQQSSSRAAAEQQQRSSSAAAAAAQLAAAQ